MKLRKVRVQMFRNILDSGEVEVQDDVTCLVGKNESGKTAFLQALFRLNPARGAAFDVLRDYPAWLEKRHRQEGRKLEDVCPIWAEFELEQADIDGLRETFGDEVVRSNSFTLERPYSSKTRTLKVSTDEPPAVRHVVSKADLKEEFAAKLADVTTFEQLDAAIDDWAADGGEAAKKAAASLEESRDEVLGEASNLNQAVINYLRERTPKFFYFAKYNELPAEVKIRRVLEGDLTELSEPERTARALLKLGGTADEYLLNPNYERRKRELENVGIGITQDVLGYWSTNDQIRVDFDITKDATLDSKGKAQTILDELKIRIRDDRHGGLSLRFDEHSAGFQWFFSFLAAFNRYEASATPVIVLLDEPGLGLHARAQHDFLRFINERLGGKRQAVYSTHSPFMVLPDKLERVRVVEDTGRERGATVSSDVLSGDPDTLFPLQGALGYDIAQHLLIGPHNLIVEGTSDYTYLTVISDFLRDAGREGLDGRWSVVPVGGADMIPTFVALLGHHLDVTVLVDARKKGHQKLSRLAENGYLAKKRIITVGEVVGVSEADIEDLFTVDEYLTFYNSRFGTDLKPSDLSGTDRLVARIARKTDQDFNHGHPADTFLRRRDEFLSRLGEDTLDRFEKLFVRLNGTLVE